ncbi:MAG: redoxin domain-containing protein [Candidatus Liptonbacteria bacterium]|nr:redoxin domain-containing protein [Candidatus Liptonbacteria bacterium]
MVKNKILLTVVLVIVAGAIYYLQSEKASPTASPQNEAVSPVNQATSTKSQTSIVTCSPGSEKAGSLECYHEISTPDGFINTKKISLGDLVGQKVILVDFWTYSCINCQRTTPYLNAWYEKYKDQGLEIIGVHTPEFEFEKKYENVTAAVKKEKIQYPVVLDNDYSTWQAYRNQYWPHKYLIDIHGAIIYDHIGEGGYAETESKIQAALAERMSVLGEKMKLKNDITSPQEEVGSDLSKIGSPETYFGAFRNKYLGSGQPGVTGEFDFKNPPEVKANTLYLVGRWKIENQYAESLSQNAKIIFKYHSKDVYFVSSAPSSTKVQILKDGHLIKSLDIQTDQLYELIKDPTYGEHTLEILIPTPGLKAFTFTFG